MAAVVYFSPLGNGTQYLSSANILALANGGTINTYAAGTTTPQATYTTSAGTVQNATSIPIGPSGTPATQIWLDVTLGYKFIILDALSNQIGPTFDNITPQTAATMVYTPAGTGAVATTVAAKLQQIVSVVDRGAVPDGTTDSTTAIQNATGSNILTWFPKTAAGSTYKITSLSFTGLANFEWKGFGVGGITITTATPGTMLTFGNTCNFGTIDGFVFTPTGVLANSIGLLFNGSAGNLEVRRCIIQLWSKCGFQHLGTVGTQMSGHKLYDSYLLQNGNDASKVPSGFGQLDLTYTNDFFITNNQFGIINTGTYGFPAFGIQATNTSNGTYASNFVWQNNIGGNFASCKYDRILAGNRFENSQKEGVIFNNCINVIFEGNWLNNNGILTTNTYNHMRWQACNRCTIANNQGFDWSGGTNTQKYGCSLESNCLNMIIKGNSFAPSPNGYATAAWLFDATMPATTNATDGALRFSSGNTIASATTTFLGKGAVGASAFICQEYLDQSHTVVQLIVQVTVAAGAGQSFIYTVYKDGVATALALTISGASTTQAVVNATTVIENVSNLSAYTVQVVTSAGAAAAAHYAQVVYCNK